MLARVPSKRDVSRIAQRDIGPLLIMICDYQYLSIIFSPFRGMPFDFIDLRESNGACRPFPSQALIRQAHRIGRSKAGLFWCRPDYINTKHSGPVPVRCRKNPRILSQDIYLGLSGPFGKYDCLFTVRCAVIFFVHFVRYVDRFLKIGHIFGR